MLVNKADSGVEQMNINIDLEHARTIQRSLRPASLCFRPKSIYGLDPEPSINGGLQPKFNNWN